MSTLLLAGAPPAQEPAPPKLLPGEALVLETPDRVVHPFGDSASEAPMGGLSHLLWVELEGESWLSSGLEFKCVGAAGPYHCSGHHGRVDLAKAMQASCSLAFMGWANLSAQRWQIDYGEGAARARLLDVFGPFLGRRVPEGEGVPELTMAWVGEGDLLRTSPEALMRWLMDPAQEQALRQFRRLVLNFYDETFKKNAWWVDAETATVTGAPGITQGWAVGGNELVLAVLRLPPGTTRADAQARFITVMGCKPGKP